MDLGGNADPIARDRRVNDEFVAMALGMIERAANAGQPCPTNENIAHSWGLKSMSSGARAIALLEKCGVISLSRGTCSRIVTIIRTGKSTGGKVAKVRAYGPGSRPTGTPKKRTDGVASAGHCGGPAYPEHQYVSRDPCGWCGVKANVGCRHHPLTPVSIGAFV